MQRGVMLGRMVGGVRRYATTSRLPVQWEHKDFYDKEKLEEETRRVLDICAGCRACFNLCDSFPALFKLIDETSPTQELDGVPTPALKPVFDACTLCDMCYEVSCPYVPPHEFNLDFPHLVLRHRAVEAAEAKEVPATDSSPFYWPHSSYKADALEGLDRKLDLQKPSLMQRLMASTDMIGQAASFMPSLTNGFLMPSSTVGQAILRKAAGIHKDAHLPSYVAKSKTLLRQAGRQTPSVNEAAPAFGKKRVVLYATCLGNFNQPDIGLAAKAVLEHLGVGVDVVYPSCCGMPQLEAGEIGAVKEKAQEVAGSLAKHVREGADVVCIVASCSLMLKKEWPLLFPDMEDVTALKDRTFDVSEYVVKIAKEFGLPETPKVADVQVTLHNACHARAQSMGFKSMEMLRLIKGIQLTPVARCSGHGGTWGVREENFETALKVGKPAMKQVMKQVGLAESAGKKHFLASDCPLALDHIEQGAHRLAEADGQKVDVRKQHPVQILAQALQLQY